MPQVVEDNRSRAARFIVRREANSREVFVLERAFASIPRVGETVVFLVTILEYELTLYGDDKQLYTTVVQVVHHDDMEMPTIYCEPAEQPYPDWAP